MKLAELHPTLSTPDREALAKTAGVDPGYLWQLATRWRGKRASLDLIQRLAKADERLTVADMVEEFSEAVELAEPKAEQA